MANESSDCKLSSGLRARLTIHRKTGNVAGNVALRAWTPAISMTAGLKTKATAETGFDLGDLFNNNFMVSIG